MIRIKKMVMAVLLNVLSNRGGSAKSLIILDNLQYARLLAIRL